MQRRSIIVAGVGMALGAGLLLGQAPEPFSPGGSHALRKMIREAVAPDGVYMLTDNLILDRSARLSFTFQPTEGEPTTQRILTAGGLRDFSVQGPLTGSPDGGRFQVTGQLTAMTGDPLRAVLIWTIVAEGPDGAVHGSSTSVVKAGEELELIQTRSGAIRVHLEFIGER